MISEESEANADGALANRALSVGSPAPDFDLEAVQAHKDPRRVRLEDYRGRWLMLIFYPRDFSFVCPTELTAFSARADEFNEAECDLLGISVDTIELHQEWLATPPDDGGIGALRFPLAADSNGEATRAYNVWVASKEVSNRGLFMIDPEGVLQYSVVHNLSVGRSVDEVLRVLHALRTGGLCPASWTDADGLIDPERQLTPGRILGHYRIERLLGAGSFGTVFLAWDLRLERSTAVKVLKRDVFRSRDHLLTEARIAARLNHPYICTIFAIEEEDGLPLIAMEYVEGLSLSEVVANGLSPSEGLQILTKLASGLAVAHAARVVHGDLKPANVLVSSEGEPKVLDFGLAKSIREEAGTDNSKSAAERSIEDSDLPENLDATIELTREQDDAISRIQGTPSYMSPEQIQGRLPTTASDVFAFGLILYEVVTGHRALNEDSISGIVRRLADQHLGEQLADDVDGPLHDLLIATLDARFDQRPAMPQVLAELETVIAASS